jgi:hypothetical protein
MKSVGLIALLLLGGTYIKSQDAVTFFSNPLNAFTLKTTELKISPRSDALDIDTLTSRSEIVLLQFLDNYWLCQTQSGPGYVSDQSIKRNVKINKKRKEELRKQVSSEYGAFISKRILQHKVCIGMTQRMAQLSLGEPIEIVRQKEDHGISERWVYNNKELFFENGALSVWKD